MTSRRRGTAIGALLITSLLVSVAPAGAVSSHLDPLSLSFPSANVGYVLSLSDCGADTCATLARSLDGGAAWHDVVVPPQLSDGLRLASWGTYGAGYATLSVYFADARDGWIYGSVPAPVTADTANPNWQSRLWSTHNGGTTWQQIRLGPLSVNGGVVTLASHGALTYLYGWSEQTGIAHILETPSTSDRWRRATTLALYTPAGGTTLEGSFDFAGSNGWLLAGNDRGFTSLARLSHDGSWSRWRSAPSAFFGGSFARICAVTDHLLLAAASSNLITSPPASAVPAGWNNGATWLFVSYDAGTSFKPLRELSSSLSKGYSDVAGLPATPVAGTILLERSTVPGGHLVRSVNWGRSWRVVLNHAVSDVVFVNRSTGYAIASTGSSPSNSTLFKTVDAGGHWTTVTP